MGGRRADKSEIWYSYLISKMHLAIEVANEVLQMAGVVEKRELELTQRHVCAFEMHMENGVFTMHLHLLSFLGIDLPNF